MTDEEHDAKMLALWRDCAEGLWTHLRSVPEGTVHYAVDVIYSQLFAAYRRGQADERASSASLRLGACEAIVREIAAIDQVALQGGSLDSYWRCDQCGACLAEAAEVGDDGAWRENKQDLVHAADCLWRRARAACGGTP